MAAPTVAFRTLGCKQNQFDTAALRFRLIAQGWEVAQSLETADCILLNTCAVTDKAVVKARGELHRLKRLSPQAQIMALGCGTAYSPDQFPADCAPETWISKFAAKMHPASLPAPHGVIPAGKTRGFLRIQSGCDQFCTFCIVPHLRGPSQSVALEDCKKSLQSLVAEGAAEVVLTGTNIALWGRDLPSAPSLYDLLRDLVQHLGDARLRLSSLEPQLITPDFLSWCLTQDQICRHFHLAFQSGSPNVLARMGREAPSRETLSFLREMSRSRPDVCLGADVLVGFPAEAENDCAETIRLVEELALGYLHVFPFSARKGTPASAFPDQIPINDRAGRAARMQKINLDCKKSFMARNLYTVQDVVRLGEAASQATEGLTSNYLHVTFKSQGQSTSRRSSLRLAQDAISAVSLQGSSHPLA